MPVNFPLAFGMPGPMEMLLVAGVALLFFGRRLPEVGRSMGTFIVEFKRGLKGIEEDIDTESSKPRVTGETPKRIESEPRAEARAEA